MTRIKICGITNKDDALQAVKLGVDMLGFVFYSGSQRYVAAEAVKDIADILPPSIDVVGVFVNEPRDSVLAAAQRCGLDMIQLHGDEPHEYCKGLAGFIKVIKAFRVKDDRSLAAVDDYPADYFLFDTFQEGEFGGSGKRFDWELLAGLRFQRPVILSGGLDHSNVEKAIRMIAPYGVDVSSGVESSPGKKDHTLMKKFIENVRNTPPRRVPRQA